MYKHLSEHFFRFLVQDITDKEVTKHNPPVLIAGAINCLEALLWNGISILDEFVSHTGMKDHNLITLLKEVGGSTQPAWTVREAAALCIAQFALLCNDQSIQINSVITHMVDSARQALSDRKYWKVRYVKKGNHH